MRVQLRLFESSGLMREADKLARTNVMKSVCNPSARTNDTGNSGCG